MTVAHALDASSAFATSMPAREMALTLQTAASPAEVDALLALAARDNPKRAHLLVSRVLGKHLAVDPRVMVASYWMLTDLFRGKQDVAVSSLADPELCVRRGLQLFPDSYALVIGYAETATALGHGVATALPGAVSVHSTRRAVPGVDDVLVFAEEHSHAVEHRVLATEAAVLQRLMDPEALVVLVDDELTTGRTILNTVAALQKIASRELYVVMTLADLRTADGRAAFDARADSLGCDVDVFSLLTGEVEVALPEPPPDLASVLAPTPASAGVVSACAWPAGLPLGDRHGWTEAHETALTAWARRTAADLALPAGARVLVLGTEEFAWPAVPLALALQTAGRTVLVQSTTRSPVLVGADPSYAVNHVRAFWAPDDPTRLSRLHNVPPMSYDVVVVLADTAPDTLGPLAAALGDCAPDVRVLSVTTPSEADA